MRLGSGTFRTRGNDFVLSDGSLTNLRRTHTTWIGLWVEHVSQLRWNVPERIEGRAMKTDFQRHGEARVDLLRQKLTTVNFALPERNWLSREVEANPVDMNHPDRTKK